MEESNNFFEIKDILKNIFHEKNMPDLRIHRLKSNWISIVGDNLSHHTSPARIQGTNLFIICDHQGWISTLQFYKEEIKKNIKNHFDNEIRIEDIKFIYNFKKENN